ncbi:hypothetical protein N9C19_00230 [bacterium]|nr:hypothetical protein [bacterium]
MKNKLSFYPLFLFFLFVFGSTQNTFSQDLASSVSNTVFALCDDNGTPMKVSGFNMFIVLHSNKGVNFLMGEDLSDAINSGSQKSGSWYSSGRKITWTWTDSGKSASAYYNYSNGNMETDDGSIFLNLGKF